MSVSQQGDPNGFGLSGTNTNSTEASSQEGATRCEGVDSPFQTILFVDDEPGILDEHCFLFEALGFCVLTAESEAGALDLLQTNRMVAVVLAYLVPGMNGQQRPRSEGQDKVPIVLSTGCFSLPEGVLKTVDVSAGRLAGLGLLLALEQDPRAVTYEEEEVLTN